MHVRVTEVLLSPNSDVINLENEKQQTNEVDVFVTEDFIIFWFDSIAFYRGAIHSSKLD